MEGGRIDHALHASKPHVAFEEVLDFEEAVQAATGMTSAEDTLLIVTADHSHVMTLNGYPPRGNDILGKEFSSFVSPLQPGLPVR